MNWDRAYDLLFEELKSRHPAFELDPRMQEARALVESLYESLPMECKGSECPIASRCPVSHRLDVVGTRCLLEVREITERLARYLKDIGLENVTYTDIQVVAHLTRTDVLVWRMEQMLSVQGLLVEEVTNFGNRVTVKQVSNPLLAELRALLKEQRAFMDELMTSRRSRLERMEREGRMERDFVRMLQQMSQRSSSLLSVEELPGLPQSSGGSQENSEGSHHDPDHIEGGS